MDNDYEFFDWLNHSHWKILFFRIVYNNFNKEKKMLLFKDYLSKKYFERIKNET